jgi:hypothetical protein
MKKLVQSATIIAEALLAMYSESAKAYFAAWIGEDWPRGVQKLSSRREAAFRSTSIAFAFPDFGGFRGLVVRLPGALSP